MFFFTFFQNAVRKESEKQWNISRRKLTVQIKFQDKDGNRVTTQRKVSSDKQ